MAQSTILLEQPNPYGNLVAVVEDDGRTVYLYLWGQNGAPYQPRAVWILNRVPAPVGDDQEGINQGMAPLMPAHATRHSQGMPPLKPEELSLVWFEEGDGVALLLRGDLLAVLPPWSVEGEFAGYSAEATGETPLAWPLTDGARQVLQPRIERAAGYWQWRREPGSWEEIQLEALQHLEERLGAHVRYWADNSTYPPIALSLFQPRRYRGVRIYTTIGMSAQVMPRVEMVHPDPAPFHRIELAFAGTEEYDWLSPLLSGLGRFPWENYTWFGDGHTVAPALTGSAILDAHAMALLLLRDPPAILTGFGMNRRAILPPDLSGFRNKDGEPVSYLWLLPISLDERELAQSRGPAELVQNLVREGRGWIWQPHLQEQSGAGFSS